MGMIHDETDNTNWEEKIGDEIEYGDAVISIDPQERLGEDTLVVSEIVESKVESVWQRGLFWEYDLAKKFAEVVDGHRLLNAEPR